MNSEHLHHKQYKKDVAYGNIINYFKETLDIFESYDFNASNREDNLEFLKTVVFNYTQGFNCLIEYYQDYDIQKTIINDVDSTYETTTKLLYNKDNKELPIGWVKALFVETIEKLKENK